MDKEEARLKKWEQELLEKEKNNAMTLNTFKDNEVQSIFFQQLLTIVNSLWKFGCFGVMAYCELMQYSFCLSLHEVDFN